MAELDQTARHALKIDPTQTLGWLVPRLEDFGFRRWLDTEMIAVPGEPKRRCDTVAELVSASHSAPPWALVLEVQAGPRANILARLLEYVARLMRKLRHGPHKRDSYPVAAVLLVLTGRQRPLRLRVQLPGTKLKHVWLVQTVNLSQMDAGTVLNCIEDKQYGGVVLCWVPLMAGAGEQRVVDRWVELARTEPDEQRRGEYAAVAEVFAERAGCLPVWRQALEGWNMWQSEVIKGWRMQGEAKGRVEEKRTDIRATLKVRFAPGLPADLDQRLEATTDLDVLSRWFHAALTAPSLEAFRASLDAPGS